MLDVRRSDGVSEQLDIEGAPRTFLDLGGQSRDSLQAGEKVSIEMHRLKKGKAAATCSPK